MTTTETFAAALRAARKSRGMSAQAVADATARLGHPVPRNTISNVETGRRSAIDLDDAMALAAAVGVTLTDLLPEAGSGYKVGFAAGVRAAAAAAERAVDAHNIEGSVFAHHITAALDEAQEMPR